jgi:crotonobetainyl-CoA:carnitine CoA-transferase CaiB-like acyl-CoA transferase
LNTLKVLELAEGVAGEYCGKLLADFGAEVIKLERPGSGSPTRQLGPLAPKGTDGERSGLFAYLNTNKRSVTLDPAAAAATGAFGKLLDRVDAVIDDHAPGWLAGIGLDPVTLDQTRPGLVLCSITAFGQAPPEDRTHAEDLTVIHASGWGYHTPTGADGSLPPLKGPGRFLPSYEAGLEAALCVVAALYDRAGSKQGRFIDISKQEVLASRVDYVLGQMVAGDMDASDKRTAFDLFGPAGIFPCRDGFVYIWMSAPGHWDGLRKLLGDPEWMRSFPERWLELECTPERVAQCRRHIAEWLQTQYKNQAAEAAQKLGLVLVPVSDARDVQASEQYAFRGFFSEVKHPAMGAAVYPTVPYKLSATPARIRTAAPLLGEYSEQALAGTPAPAPSAGRK